MKLTGMATEGGGYDLLMIREHHYGKDLGRDAKPVREEGHNHCLYLIIHAIPSCSPSSSLSYSKHHIYLGTEYRDNHSVGCHLQPQ